MSKALIFLTCKQNIIIYSQMRFQLYQSHCLTAIRLQRVKKSINWVSVDILETLRLKIFHRQRVQIGVASATDTHLSDLPFLSYREKYGKKCGKQCLSMVFTDLKHNFNLNIKS